MRLAASWADLRESRREKLTHRQYLGHWPEGTLVVLADFIPDDRGGHYVKGHAVTVVRNGAIDGGGGVVAIEYVATGARCGADALAPVWSGPGYVR